MSKSIWDTRFNGRGYAQDAIDEDDGEWRTVNGAHIHINSEGVIDAGAGGKFSGKTLSEFGSGSGRNSYGKSPKPNYVRPLTHDSKGNPLKNETSTPETLADVKDYCRKILDGPCGDYRNSLERLKNAADSWQKQNRVEKNGQFEGRNQIQIYKHQFCDNLTTREGRQRWAESCDRRLQEAFNCTRKDPTGIGKWLATDMFNTLESGLTLDRREYYEKRMKKWQ